MKYKQNPLFFPKRLVFDTKGPEGNKSEEAPKKTADQIAKDAKESAISDAMKKEGDVGDIKTDAETKIDATKDADDKTKLDAKKKLDDHKADFDQAKAYIGLRTKAKTTLKQFDESKDNNWKFENIDQLEKAKDDLSKNKFAEAELKTSVEAKVTEVRATAETYYSESLNNAGEQVSVLTQSPTMEEITKAYELMSKLQANKLTKFKGLAADKMGTLAKDTDTNIANLIKAIDEAQGKLPEADQQKFKDLYSDGLKIAKTADSNFNASRNGEPGWKAGAEQYLAMSVAQGKALTAKEGIPRSDKAHDNWHVNDASELDSWGAQYAGTVAIYKQALTDFDAAQKLSANKNAGDSTKAMALFDKARQGFMAVKGAADAQKQGETVKEEKTNAETAQTEAKKTMDGSQKYLDENLVTVGNAALLDYARTQGGSGEKGAWADGIKAFNEGVALLKEGKNAEAKTKLGEATTKFDTSKTGYEKALADYNKMVEAGNKEMGRAVENVQGYDGTPEQYQNTFADYLSNPAVYNSDAALGKVFQSLALQTTFVKDGNTYTADASFPEGGGRANVTVSMKADSTGAGGGPDAGTGGGPQA